MLLASAAAVPVPTPPSGVEADPGNGAVKVSFAEAPVGDDVRAVFGSPLFLVTAQAAAGGEDALPEGTPTTALVSSSPAYLLGLPNAVDVTLTVQALHEGGTPSDAVTAEPEVVTIGAPARPGSVDADSSTEGEFDVSWRAPQQNAAALTSFTVSVDPPDVPAVEVPVTDAEQVVYTTTLSGLSASTPYTVSVVATNSIGTSPPGSPSGMQVPAGASGAIHVASGETYALDGSGDISVSSVVVESGGVLQFTANGQRLVAGAVTVDGTVTVTGSAKTVSIQASEMSVTGTGAVHTDGAVTSHDESSPGWTSINVGASHGGAAANTAPSTVYGSPLQPVDIGTCAYRGPDNKGGGAVRVDVTGALTIDGRVSASAAYRTSTYRGSCSGGSVYITCGTLHGSGTIAADGASSGSGSGGGGRVAVYAADASQHAAWAGQVRAEGGGSSHAQRRPGTVYFTVPGIVDEDAIHVADGARLYHLWWPEGGSSLSFDAITIGTGSVLGFSPGFALITAELSIGSGSGFQIGTRTVSSGQSSPTSTISVADSVTIASGCDLRLAGIVDVSIEGAFKIDANVPVITGSISLDVDGAVEIGAASSVVADDAITISATNLTLGEAASVRSKRLTTGVIALELAGSAVIAGHVAAARVTLVSESLHLTSADAAIDSDRLSYDTQGAYLDPTVKTAGASHGAQAEGADAAPEYGDPLHPVDVGSRSWATDARGGGAVRIIVAESIVMVAGSVISSDAMIPDEENPTTAEINPRYEGGGSGGSVWITARSLEGAGDISAFGHYPWGSPPKGGTGGRIAVYLQETTTWSGSITAPGKRGAGGSKWLHGTVYLEFPGLEPNAGSIVVPSTMEVWPLYIPQSAPEVLTTVTVQSGGVLGLRQSVATVAFELVGNAKLLVSAVHDASEFELQVLESFDASSDASIDAENRNIAIHLHFAWANQLLDISSGAGLRLQAPSFQLVGANGAPLEFTAHTALEVVTEGALEMTSFSTLYGRGSLHVQAASIASAGELRSLDVLVEVSGAISLTGIGAINSDYTSTSTRGRDTVAPAGTAELHCRAPSHAGYGGEGDKEPYGWAFAPVDAGSKGWTDYGGGVVRVIADSVELVDAESRISSLGKASRRYSGGSGGSVWISTRELSGAGAIRADGGANTIQCGWPGSGGRIAVYVTEASSSWTGTISASARGKAANSDVPAGGASGAGTVVVATPDEVVLQVINHYYVGGDVHDTIVYDKMGPTDAIDTLHVQGTTLQLRDGAHLRTRALSGTSGVIDIDRDYAVVVLGSGVCDGVLGNGVTVVGGLPLLMRLEPDQPTEGNFAAGSKIQGVVNSAAAAGGDVLCRFGDMVVVASTSAHASCPDAFAFTCDVPADPRDVETVSVTLSVDAGASFHEFDPPHTFRFIPDAVCNLFGTPDFPSGCTVEMLGDTTCDAACNTRACAHDNRDCEAPAVIVAPDGDDSNDGTPESPVATLETAVQLACSGFAQCLPVLLQPGTYDCAATAFSTQRRVISIAAADADADSPRLAACAADDDTPVPGLRVLASELTLSGLSVGVPIVATNASIVTLEDCVFGEADSSGEVVLVDSLLAADDVRVAPHTSVRVEYDSDRAASTRGAYRDAGRFCPACVALDQDADTLLLRAADVAWVKQGSDANNVVLPLALLALPAAGASLNVTVVQASTTEGGVAALQHLALSGDVEVPAGSSTAASDCTVDAGTAWTFHRSVGDAALSSVVFTRVALKMLASTIVANGELSPRADTPEGSNGILRVSTSRVELEWIDAQGIGDGGLPLSLEDAAPLLHGPSWSAGAVGVLATNCRFRGAAQGLRLEAPGGAIATITSCSFEGLVAGEGAALWALDATISITGSSFVECAASQQAGAVYVGGDSEVAISDAVFVGNVAQSGGGAAAMFEHEGGSGSLTVEINGCLLQGNEGFGGGGGLRFVGHRVDAGVHDCDVIDNSDTVGGGVYVEAATLLLERSKLLRNSAFAGGNIYLHGGDMSVSDTVIGDSSSYNAAGIQATSEASLHLLRTTIANCSSDTAGAALDAGLGCTVSLEDCAVEASVAAAGGAVLIESGSQLSLLRSAVTGNLGAAPALHVTGSNSLAVIEDSTVATNSVPDLAHAAPGGIGCDAGASLRIATGASGSSLAGNLPYNLACTGCSAVVEADATGQAAALLRAVECSGAAGVAPVAVHNVTPSVVGTAGGDPVSVQLSGEHTPGAPANVFIGGRLAATGVVVSSDGVVPVATGEGSGSDHSVVSFVEGRLASVSSAVTLAYARPVVFNVTPAVLPAAGGMITLDGANFGPQHGNDVRIDVNNVECGDVAVESHARVRCRVGPGVGLEMPVKVTVDGLENFAPAPTLSMANNPAAASVASAVPQEREVGGQPAPPTSLAVSLVTPDMGGVPFSHFVVSFHATEPAECSDGDSGIPREVVALSGDTVLTGLQSGCLFSVAARAVNEAQLSGDWSEPVEARLAFAPSAPQLLGTRRGVAWPTGMAVSILPGFFGGAPAVEFSVSLSGSLSFTEDEIVRTVDASDAASDGTSEQDGAIAFEIAELAAHAVYYVRVSTTTAAGTSPYSTAQLSEVLVGRPSAPTIVSTAIHIESDDPRVVVAFTPPVVDGGYPVELYRAVAEVQGEGDDATSNITLAPAEASAPPEGSPRGSLAYEAEGLPLGAVVRFRLAAANAFDASLYGDASAPSEWVVVGTVPSAPTLSSDDVSVLAFDDTVVTIEVAWTAAFWRGLPIARYSLTVERVDGSGGDDATVAVQDVEVVGDHAEGDGSTVLSSTVVVPYSLTATQYDRRVRVSVTAVNSAGTSQPSGSVQVRLPCRSGFGANDPERLFCSQCLPGEFADDTPAAALAGVPCSACPQGSASSVVGATSCDPCEVGTYQPRPRQVDCLQPPPGSVAAGPGAIESVVCDAGFAAATNQTQCERCPHGWASNGAGSSECTECAPGEYATADGASCVQCPQGSVSATPGATECSLCPAGTYQPRPGQIACLVPPPGDVAEGTGAIATDTCGVGFVPSTNRSQCVQCLPGWVSNGAGSSECVECAAGEMAIVDDVTSRCSKCESGTYSPSPASVACEPCADGYIAPAAGATECTACPAGTREVDHERCEPCEAGSHSPTAASVACIECLPGTYQPRPGQIACLVPPPGDVAEGTGTIATDTCGVGFVPSTNRSQCVQCLPGWVSNGAGSSECVECAAGEMAIVDDVTSRCSKCESGTYSPSPASVACEPCADGYIAPAAGATECTACPAGTREVDHERCEPCEAGSHSPTAASVACIECLPGTYQELDGQRDCSAVGPGQYTPDAGATQPFVCPVGTAATADGQSCTACPPGSVSMGAEASQCVPCRAGEVPALDAGSCEQCDPGFYQPVNGGMQCLPCAVGSIAGEAGASMCVECRPGERSVLGTRCEVCPANFFVNPADLSECLECPENGANCVQGQLQLKEGFWSPQLSALATGDVSALGPGGSGGNASASEVAFYECAPGACVFNDNGTLSCAAGREGPLCAICKENHVVTGTECVPCETDEEGKARNWALMSVLLLGVAAGTLKVTRRAIERANATRPSKGKPNMLSPATTVSGVAAAAARENRAVKARTQAGALGTAMAKIFVNHLQVISFLGGFALPWSPEVSTLWSLAGSGTSIPVNAAFVQCSVSWSFYARFRAAASLPVSLALILLLIPVYQTVKGGRRHWSTYTISLLVLSYLLYPTISREALRLLNCSSPVEGKQYLKVDYRVECGTAEHSLHSALAVVVLLGFSVGLPVYSYFALRKDQRRAAATGRHLFSFLSDGYRARYYWWETTVMVRKLVLVGVAVLFSDSSDGLQVFMGLGVVVTFLCAHLSARPFENATQHALETAAQLVAAVSLYAGWLLTLDISDTVRHAVSVLLVLINVSLAVVFVALLMRTGRQGAAKALRRARAAALARRSRLRGHPPHSPSRAAGGDATVLTSRDVLGLVSQQAQPGKAMAWRDNPLTTGRQGSPNGRVRRASIGELSPNARALAAVASPSGRGRVRRASVPGRPPAQQERAS